MSQSPTPRLELRNVSRRLPSGGKDLVILDRVDLSVAGDIEEVEIEMGLRTHRSTPRPRFNLFDHYNESLGLADRDIDDPSFGYPPPRRVAKVGRNDPCPCGSGKKYKKCCLN